MHTKESTSLARLIAIYLFIFLFATIIHAKSLYVSMVVGHNINAYKIQGSNIQYQTDVPNIPYYNFGAIGLALDSDSGSIFLTAENDNKIYLLNAKTMVLEDTLADIYGEYNLSGIVFDQDKQKLYVVKRGTDHLYVFFWDSQLKTLFLDGDSYKEIYLGLSSTAYGLALDENTSRLYVTNATNSVHYFDTDTWEHKGSISIDLPPFIVPLYIRVSSVN